MALEEGRNDPPPSMVVLLLSAKSAEPPHISGSFFASALITSPDALRVATSLPASKLGTSESQSAGNSFAIIRERSFARSGSLFFHVSNLLFQESCAAAPRSLTKRAWDRSFSGKAKCSSGFNPSSFLVAAISSAPNADPCDFEVPFAFGAGQAMTVFNRIRVGCLRLRPAVLIALSRFTKSTSPLDNAATSITSHPYAR